jgi:hypothetical protein
MVQKNNTRAFSNGQLSTSVSEGIKVQLDNYRYTFLRGFGDTLTGSYWIGNKTCIVNTSSFANVNDIRTIDKVARITYSTLTPELNSEVLFNGDGTLQLYTIEYFKDLVTAAVTQEMITGFGVLPLISGISVKIDPTQPIKTTQNLVVVVTIVQNGIARKITVNIAYGTITT